MKKKRKSLVLWGDDDWVNLSKQDLEDILIMGTPEDKPCYAVFHAKKKNCYEGKPRKVRITIEEI